MKAKNKPVLRLLEGGYGTVQPDPRCQIAAKVVMAGPQGYRVYGGNAQATGRGHGVISLRVGRSCSTSKTETLSWPGPRP